jgi:hypothetical protein
MTYREAIAEGKRLYAEAMDKAANYVLFVIEEYGKPRATVCREIAGNEGWNALDIRTRKLAKTAGQTPDERRAGQLAKTQRNREASARAVLKDPEQAAKVIASLPAETLDTLYHEARLIRAGEDRSPAARKAAGAAANQAVAPMKRALAQTSAALGIQALEEALEDLREALSEGALTQRQIAKADGLVNEIANLLMEAKFGAEVTQ